MGIMFRAVLYQRRIARVHTSIVADASQQLEAEHTSTPLRKGSLYLIAIVTDNNVQ